MILLLSLGVQKVKRFGDEEERLAILLEHVERLGARSDLILVESNLGMEGVDIIARIKNACNVRMECALRTNADKDESHERSLVKFAKRVIETGAFRK